ncbi:MAG TPA: carboxylesterase/lipase family protein [Ilumatobacteraceae bacterium]|nr:carboxylesterase/lipase family protein [Ilumatobacteraceae bacterium]
MSAIVDTPIVETRPGKVRGAVSDGVKTFKGIAYAAPPFGVNRFRTPQPVEPWSGVRDALTFGPKPPQVPYPSPFELLIPDYGEQGEDCLNLNIWAPAGSSGHPVMVWIPGGAFEHGTGAASAYSGSRFARDGIVCVTINYRVGADGFLFLGSGTANLGLLDQLAALEWVRDNIAAFGGDPDNVTIFGESAGAMSVSTLLSMPRAAGLFRRAIAQSGGASIVISADTAQLVGRLLADKLGVAATRTALAAIPTQQFLRAQVELSADLAANPDPATWGREVALSMMPWQPVIDGEIIPANPIDQITGGAAASIDLMVGTTTDEWRLFLVPSGAMEHITTDMVAGVVTAYGLPVAETLALYRAENPDASPGDLLAALLGDWYIGIPAMRLADAHSNSTTNTFVYEFAWRSPQFAGLLGACHGLEIPFVFETLANGMEPLLGSDPPQALADTMHAAWVSFAATGDSGWPQYDLERRATMRFGTPSEVVDDPRSAQRELWDNARLSTPVPDPSSTSSASGSTTD